MNKEHCFGYILYKVIEWMQEERGITEEEALLNINSLYVNKMLFFVASFKVGKLLDIFDNFHATEMGSVEVDVYKSIIENKIPRYAIGGRYTGIKIDESFFVIDEPTKSKIDWVIAKMKHIAPHLIWLNADELVDENKKWSSWRWAYELAKIEGKSSGVMDIGEIKGDAILYYNYGFLD